MNNFKKNQVFGSKTVHREIGNYMSRIESCEKSLKYYDESIKNNPEDKRALIQRSRARAKCSHYKESIDDVNKALKIDKNDITAMECRALNTYLKSEFEDALVQNTRIMDIRTKPEFCRIGAMQCTTAIHNCIGDCAGRPLRDHCSIIRKLAWQKTFNIHKKKYKNRKWKPFYKEETLENQFIPIKSVKSEKSSVFKINVQQLRDNLQTEEHDKCYVPSLEDKLNYRPQQKCTSNISNYMAEKYLDTMYHDKIFLQKLHNNSGVSSPNKQGSIKIKEISISAYKKLCYKQECLRFRRPFYSVKYMEVIPRGALKQRQELDFHMLQQCTIKEADVILNKLRQAFEKQNLLKLLEVADKLRKFCDAKSKQLFPSKEVYLNELFDKIRMGYYGLYRINHQQYEWEQVKRVLVSLGLPISREPSTDSVIKNLEPINIDNRKQIEKYENRLKYAETPDDISWCYYELCKNNIELKQWELAKICANKCIQIAQNNEWNVNANMLLAKISINEHNKLDAKKYITEAMTFAKEVKDNQLTEYLNICLDVIEKIEFDDKYGAKCIERRAKNIVALLENPILKEEFSLLYNRMSALPASRRLNIVPGLGMKTEFVKHPKKKDSFAGQTKPHLPKPVQEKVFTAVKHEAGAMPSQKKSKKITFARE